MGTEVTLGTFLAEKMQNMLNWIEAEAMPGSLLLDEIKTELTALRATYIATALARHEAAVQARDWSVFEALRVEEQHIDDRFWAIINAVKLKTELHDKLWKCMAMFSEVINSN